MGIMEYGILENGWWFGGNMHEVAEQEKDQDKEQEAMNWKLLKRKSGLNH